MGLRIALGAIALMVLGPCCLHAEQCEDYSSYFSWIGAVDLNGEDVRCSGGLLYVAFGAFYETGRGLRIYSVLDPHNPVLVGSVSTTGDAYGQPVSLEVSGNLAFVCSGGVFHVVDISNPSAPALVGTTTGFGGGRIASNGQYAYVANGGLVVVDVSDPAAPELLGGVSVPGFTSDVKISGNLGCASIYKEGPGPSQQVLDLSNPCPAGDHRQRTNAPRVRSRDGWGRKSVCRNRWMELPGNSLCRRSSESLIPSDPLAR